MDLVFLDEKGLPLTIDSSNTTTIYYKKDQSTISVIFTCSRSFKLTDHRYSIQFTHRTILSEVLVAAPSIPKTKFRIHTYDSLLKLANTNQSLPDVVGRLSFVWGSRLPSFGSFVKTSLV